MLPRYRLISVKKLPDILYKYWPVCFVSQCNLRLSLSDHQSRVNKKPLPPTWSRSTRSNTASLIVTSVSVVHLYKLQPLPRGSLQKQQPCTTQMEEDPHFLTLHTHLLLFSPGCVK